MVLEVAGSSPVSHPCEALFVLTANKAFFIGIWRLLKFAGRLNLVIAQNDPDVLSPQRGSSMAAQANGLGCGFPITECAGNGTWNGVRRKSRVRKTQRTGKFTHVARRFAGCFRIDVSDRPAANLRVRRLTLET